MQLTTSQGEAVTNRARNLQILASASSGKTAVQHSGSLINDN